MSGCNSILANCAVQRTVSDADVQQALDEIRLNLKAGGSKETVYLTIFALAALEKCYAGSRNEWEMIARKGRTYLVATGVTKVNTLIAKFKLNWM